MRAHLPIGGLKICRAQIHQLPEYIQSSRGQTQAISKESLAILDGAKPHGSQAEAENVPEDPHAEAENVPEGPHAAAENEES